MKELYEACDNYQNYILILDTEKDENNTCIVDWDLSEEEVADITERFNRDEYDESNAAGELIWFPFDEVNKKFNSYHAL